MKPVRDKKHLAFVASLPCCCTGSPVDVVVHHLLRVPGHEKCMGRRSGDDKTIPLNATVHMALHGHGNESLFLEKYGINGIELAKQLWEVSGDIEAGERIIREARTG